MACVMEAVSANYQSDVRFEGPAKMSTENGDITVDASDCIGGCSVNGRCMEAATISKSTAELACNGNKMMKTVGAVFGVLLVLVFFLAFCY